MQPHIRSGGNHTLKVLPTLGVVGGGIWATHHMDAARDFEREGKARLSTMCARTEATVGKMTKDYSIEGTTNYRELLRKPEINCVSIVTPDHLHKEMALEAIHAGKHVIIEKPMDLTVEGCEEMTRAAEEHQVLLFVDFHKRYDPVHQRTRQMIQSGKIGTVQYGYAYMEDKIIVPRDWFPHWAPFTSPFWFIGVHQVDMLRWTLGSEVTEVNARGFRGKLDSMGIDTLDSVHAVLTFGNGAVFTVNISWILPDRFEALVNQGARFIGTDGILELDTQDRGFKGCSSAESTQTFNLNSNHTFSDGLGQVQHEGYFIDPIKDFLKLTGYLLNGGTLNEVRGKYPGGEDGTEATRVSLAVHESTRLLQPVKLNR